MVTDDLVQRCLEIQDWHKTGLLNGGSGGALRAYAKAIPHPLTDGEKLSMAEKYTADEAMQAIIALSAPVEDGEIEDVAESLECAVSVDDGEAAVRISKNLVREAAPALRSLSARLAETKAELERVYAWKQTAENLDRRKTVELVDAKAAVRELRAKLAEAERERDAHKRRGDNHWETLRGIRHIAREGGDLERIILWVNDAGRGYVETADKSLAQLADERNAAIARADKADAEVHAAHDVMGLALIERDVAIAERDRLAGLVREAGEGLEEIAGSFEGYVAGLTSETYAPADRIILEDARALASRLKAEGGAE